MALQAKPNPAHYALAELARKKPNFVTLSQNVDGRPCSNVLLIIVSHMLIHDGFLSHISKT